MKLLAQMRKQHGFWFVVASILCLLILYLWTSWFYHNWYHYKVEWDNLPPLPNGEVPIAFTDVLPRNRINVMTKRGNYYSCPYETLKKCWIPIPREVNTPICENPEIRLPDLPDDTMIVGCTYRRYRNGDGEAIMAIIRKGGQISIWIDRQDVAFFEFFHHTSDLCCGSLFLFVGIMLALIVQEARSDLKIMKS